MPKYKLRYEAAQAPRMGYQFITDRVCQDLDRMVVDRDNIHIVANWALTLLRQNYTGAEILGPVKPQGGAVIDLGDLGELLILPM